MNKRIVRFECASYDNNGRKELFRYKWTRGKFTIPEVYHIWKEHSFMKSVSYGEFLEMVRMCKENSNVVMDDEEGKTIQIRRWSYHRKG